MNDVKELREHRSRPIVIYSEFLEIYDKHNTNTCYGFVEGKDDPSYYKTLIGNRIGASAKVLLFPSGKKENVKKIYQKFNWNRYDKKRICFFQDRDLHGIITDIHTIDSDNAYLTDGYSIENDIASSNVFRRVLRDVMGFELMTILEENMLANLYDTQKAVFLRKMSLVMSHIIYWRLHDIDCEGLNNIKVDKLISINSGIVCFVKEDKEVVDYIYERCKVDQEDCDESCINEIFQYLSINDEHEKIIRGKYLAEFFVLFCNSIRRDCDKMNIIKWSKGREICTKKDIREVVSPRCQIPQSLESFLSRTFLSFLNTSPSQISSSKLF